MGDNHRSCWVTAIVYHSVHTPPNIASLWKLADGMSSLILFFIFVFSNRFHIRKQTFRLNLFFWEERVSFLSPSSLIHSSLHLSQNKHIHDIDS